MVGPGRYRNIFPMLEKVASSKGLCYPQDLAWGLLNYCCIISVWLVHDFIAFSTF